MTDQPAPPATPAPDEPPWLAVARRELGVSETGGAASTPRIDEYLATAGMHPDDELPWCSAFVNWCIEQTGMKGTDAGAARSWLRWGTQIGQPRVGAITVLWREDPAGPKGHVGFFLRALNGQVFLLGGNQSNSVCVRSYPAARVLSYQWPSVDQLATMREAAP